LTIDDTLIKNQHKSDWDSYSTAKRKAIRMCENLLMNDIIKKIDKAFPKPKVKPEEDNLVQLRR
jgi:phosphoribosylformylglycinamidine (FGAM) synthase PurS component